MTDAVDAFLLAAIGAPLLGAAFVAAVPNGDRIALRHAGMGAALLALVFGVLCIRGGLPCSAGSPDIVVGLLLDGAALPAFFAILISTPLALRAGAPRVQGGFQGYVIAVLLHESLALIAVCSPTPFVALAAAQLAGVPLFALLALHGGPQRGSTAQRAASLWLVVDTLGLGTLAFLAGAQDVPLGAAGVELADAAAALPGPLQVVTVVLVLGPGLVRLGAGPHGVWSWTFFEQAPVSAGCLAVAAAAPLGANLIGKVLPVAAPGLPAALPTAVTLLVLAAAIGAILILAEKDLRRMIAHLCGISGAAAAVAVLSLDGDAAAYGSWFTVVAGLSAAAAMMAVEALERRLETRDATELIGLFSLSPPLAAALVLGLLGCCGAPVFGSGAALAPMFLAIAAAHGMAVSGAPPASSLVVAGGLVLAFATAAAGVAWGCRRLLLMGPKRDRRFVRVTISQEVRLFIPLAAAAAAAWASPWAVQESRRAVSAQVAQAHEHLPGSPVSEEP